MVKLSLPLWDKDKSRFQAGTSFAPNLAGRFKSPASSTTPAVLRRLKSPDTATSTQPTHHPLMTLRLSSPSFLDSVIHDGSSDNPLYVIDTDDNVTKIRRSDPKGFVKVCSVRWPTEPVRSISRKNKDLIGVEVAFGRGTWKSADDFLGYSYSSLSSYRKFYLPHYTHSLKWKPCGSHYACTTETVKGPVAILEPAALRSPPQLKIIDPLFRVGTSRPQRMHNGIALSLLDFLLVTAMLLLTPNDEWMNVTRTSPSDLVPDSGPPYDSSYSHEPPDKKSLLLTSESTQAIERWRTVKPPPVAEDNRSECGESSDGRTSSSRATSRLSFHTEAQSTVQHSTYSPGREPFAARSDSSLSLASHALTSPRRGRGRTRELPVPPIPLSHGPSFSRGPPSVSSYASHVSHLPHGQHSQDEPPPVPPLPGSSSTSSPSHDVHSPINPTSVFSRHVAGSPTSIHSRSLPIPPTPSGSKPRLPLLPLVALANSTPVSPISPLPGPVSPIPHRPSLLRTHSHTQLRNASTAYPDSPRDFKPLTKTSLNYSTGSPNSPPLPISTHASAQRGTMNLSLSIRTTDVAPVLRGASASAVSADMSFSSEEPDPFDMPPAYSVVDMSRSSSQLQIVHGEMGR